MSYEIIHLEKDDFLELLKLEPNKHLLKDNQQELKLLIPLIIQIKDCSIIVALEEQKIIGFSRIEITHENGISTLVPRATNVMQDRRRQGIATQLLTKSFDIAAQATQNGSPMMILVSTLTEDGEKLIDALIEIQKSFPSVTLKFQTFKSEDRKELTFPAEHLAI